MFYTWVSIFNTFYVDSITIFFGLYAQRNALLSIALRWFDKFEFVFWGTYTKMSKRTIPCFIHETLLFMSILEWSLLSKRNGWFSISYTKRDGFQITTEDGELNMLDLFESIVRENHTLLLNIISSVDLYLFYTHNFNFEYMCDRFTLHPKMYF